MRPCLRQPIPVPVVVGDQGRRAGLSPDVIAAAALDHVDEHGLDALSMRALARRLDVTPMALYNHVAGKDELLVRLVDLMAEEMAGSRPSGSWREQVEAVAHAMRSTHLAHPEAISLVLTTDSTSEAVLRPIELALDGFARAGLDVRRSRAAWIGLVGLVTGHVAYEIRGHFVDPVDPAGVPAQLDRLHAVLSAGPAVYDEAFADALRWYLDGIERQAGPTASP